MSSTIASRSGPRTAPPKLEQAVNRNRYADLLRVVAIGAVVYGHWIVTSITYSHGRYPGKTVPATSAGSRAHAPRRRLTNS